MKTDFSQLPREEVEARITTMLLGEMPPDEAAELMEFVSRDSELLKLHDELKETISLVTEASANEQPMKLSEGRREQLLESFKMVKPPELAEKTHGKIEWRNWAAMAAMVGLLLGGAAFVFNGTPRYETATTIALNLPGGGRSDDRQREQLREEAEAAGLKEYDGKISVTGQVLPGTFPPARDKERLNEKEVRRAPQKPPVNGPVAATRGRAAVAVTSSSKEEAKLAARMSENALARAKADFGRAEKAQESAAATKIELPVAQTDAPVQAKSEAWQFQAGQARGYGGYGGGGAFGNRDDSAKRSLGVADGEEPRGVYSANAVGYVDTTIVPGFNLQSKPFATGAVVGKDATLAYADHFGARPAEPALQAINGAVNTPPPAADGFFDSSGVVDAKKKGVAIDAVTGLPTGSITTSSAIDPSTGLPAAPGAAEPSVAEQDEKDPSSGQMGGGMGGGANMSMMYYMSNPELMKRYFPQMYSMMQKGREAGATPNSSAGISGGSGLAGSTVLADADQDSLGRKEQEKPAMQPPMAMTMPSLQGYDRYRMLPGLAAKKPEAKFQPEQQVALGTELKLLKEDSDGSQRQKEVADVAKKSELVTVSGDKSERLLTDNNGLIQLNQGSLAFQPNDVAATEAVRRSVNNVEGRREQLAAGRQLTESEKATIAENLGKKPAESVVSRVEEFTNERSAASTKVQDARFLIEMGRTEEAQKKLDEVIKVDPQNRGAAFYLNQIKEQKNAQEARKGEIAAKDALVKVDQSWDENAGREMLRRDVTPQRPKMPAATPQPEVSTAENAFSTFSLNVSDVSFKLAAASLEKGLMPDAATVRSEEFINAFDYRDPEPQGAPIGFVWERARYPFAQGRDLLRFSVKTAASGRQAGRPLNLVLLLDNSGSMERADRVRILQECLKTLAAQLHPEDKVSVVAFARTARLWVDGLPGSQANELAQRVGNLNPEGGTNLEEAMKVAYETARKHFNAGGVNRVVLLTDGAANLGDVEPESLKREVETERKKGIALDCFGIGWEGLNDELLETLSRNGDGRYGFVNTPEAAGSEFAGQLAGALQVAASDVKVQVEWNPKRVTAFRQIGYAKHQLTKEQFRDNTVDAAEIGAAEAGNALYVVQVNAAGEGPLGTVRVRFKVPGTSDYREHAWPLDYDGAPKPLENSNYTLRLAGAASAFSEWLVSSPYATEVTTDKLLTILSGVPEHFAPDPRPTKLEWMIRQAKSLAGK